MAERIQLRRTKAWKKPAGAVVVARPTRWGNPYLVGPVTASFPSLSDAQVHQFVVNDFKGLVERGRGRCARGARMSSPEFEDVTYPSVAEIRAELAGRDLCCWCRPGLPCHADVLLRVAAGGNPWEVDGG